MLIPVARRLQRALGLAETAADPGRVLLREISSPLEAAVVEALGLDGEPREHWVVRGTPVTVQEVAAAQGEWLAARPHAVAAVLTRHALRPAAVARLVMLRLASPAPRPSPRRHPFATAPGGHPMTSPEATLLVVGPPSHGVTHLARTLAGAGELLRDDAAIWLPDLTAVPPELAHDPRIQAGDVPVAVLERARLRVSLPAPLVWPGGAAALAVLAARAGAGQADEAPASWCGFDAETPGGRVSVRPTRWSARHTGAITRTLPTVSWPVARPARDLGSLEALWGGWT